MPKFDIDAALGNKKALDIDAALGNAGARIDTTIADIPRQIGLTARSALKGGAEMVGVVSNPIANLLSMATGRNIPYAGETATQLADVLGLPQPQTPTERIAGKGVEMVTGGGGMIGAARGAAQALPAVGREVARTISAAPIQQLAGAAGGGIAGEYAKETGGGSGAQMVSALAGSLGGAAGAGTTMKIYDSLKNLTRSMRTPGVSSADITVKLNSILAENGIDARSIPTDIRATLLTEMQSAMKTGKEIRPDVVRRLADYAVVGAKPTRGSVTLDPALITQERNLAKLGAGSPNVELQQMAQTQRQNDLLLAQRLNELGAGKAMEPVAAGRDIQSALKGIDAPRKAAVDAAYQSVRDSSGRYADLDVSTFSKLANEKIDAGQFGGVLPAEARNYLNAISSGQIPLNVNTYIQLDKRLSGIARKYSSGGDKDAALAVKQIRDALNETPVSGTVGESARARYDLARQMAAKRFQAIEENPAMAAALDDTAPDKFVKTYLIGRGNKANERDVMSLSSELRKDPEAFKSAKEQILYHLKQQALSGKADEVANFSPHAYNKAVSELGDKKLRMFFNKDEFNMLKAVGRVASYEKFQPTGSAVNNSNSASAFAGLLERVASSPIASRIPFGGVALREPAQQWSAQIQARQAMSPLGALMQQPNIRRQSPALSALLLPAIAGQSGQ